MRICRPAMRDPRFQYVKAPKPLTQQVIERGCRSLTSCACSRTLPYSTCCGRSKDLALAASQLRLPPAILELLGAAAGSVDIGSLLDASLAAQLAQAARCHSPPQPSPPSRLSDISEGGGAAAVPLDPRSDQGTDVSRLAKRDSLASFPSMREALPWLEFRASNTRTRGSGEPAPLAPHSVLEQASCITHYPRKDQLDGIASYQLDGIASYQLDGIASYQLDGMASYHRPFSCRQYGPVLRWQHSWDRACFTLRVVRQMQEAAIDGKGAATAEHLVAEIDPENTVGDACSDRDGRGRSDSDVKRSEVGAASMLVGIPSTPSPPERRPRLPLQVPLRCPCKVGGSLYSAGTVSTLE